MTLSLILCLNNIKLQFLYFSINSYHWILQQGCQCVSVSFDAGCGLFYIKGVKYRKRIFNSTCTIALSSEMAPKEFSIFMIFFLIHAYATLKFCAKHKFQKLLKNLAKKPWYIVSVMGQSPCTIVQGFWPKFAKND